MQLVHCSVGRISVSRKCKVWAAASKSDYKDKKSWSMLTATALCTVQGPMTWCATESLCDRPTVNTSLFRTDRSFFIPFFIPVTNNLNSEFLWFTSTEMLDNKKLDSLNCALTRRGHLGCNGIPCHSYVCGVEIGKCSEYGVRWIQLHMPGTQMSMVLSDCLTIKKLVFLEDPHSHFTEKWHTLWNWL